jgi:carbamoyl-phosphate synthase small subunit
MLAKVPSMDGLELASYVSTEKEYELGDSSSPVRIAVMDYGCKQHYFRMYDRARCLCKSIPAKTTAARLKEFKPSGYFISNGPGDPAAMGYAIETVKEILKENKPTFGICLGTSITCFGKWRGNL